MSIDNIFFRQVMGHFATGVTVVTTRHEGVVGGLTVNAFCSVSLNPPLVLISVDLASNTLPLIQKSGIFAVNILTQEQEYLSRCFATQSRDRYESFCNASYTTAATGAPILNDALAFVEARVVAEYPGGDHMLFLGQVEGLGTQHQRNLAQDTQNGNALNGVQLNGEKESEPLLYYRGQYQQLAKQYQASDLPEVKTPSHAPENN